MFRITLAGSVLMIVVLAAPSVRAAEVTVQGEVVDPAAYLKSGQHGAAQENTTYEAVDGGQTLALLDETSHALYLLLAEAPGEDPNELVYDFVNKTVKATGELYERDGVKGFVLKTVEPVGGSEPAAGAPAARPTTSPVSPASPPKP